MIVRRVRNSGVTRFGLELNVKLRNYAVALSLEVFELPCAHVLGPMTMKLCGEVFGAPVSEYCSVQCMKSLEDKHVVLLRLGQVMRESGEAEHF